ncbi:hypothetical protein JK358_37180 [Nocardia sp. 2]|uniref:Uncharacterized protein n=1 Tax=Nocardia acididurans TaxID=2802282 RepID=A0ABS1MHA1_9NOCA|nr:hypothetical protein [Nocardia acididurans]MBL1080045.1 hypothetical protein [Nocardia acididurans]
MKTIVTRVGLAFAALAATLAVTAPQASAEPAGRGACLTIANDSRNAIRIVMRTTPIGNQPGWAHDIPAHSVGTLVDGSGRYLLSPDGKWDITAPAGSWAFDPKFREGACKGVWNFTVK